MHQTVPLTTPGSVDIWSLYDDNTDIPVNDAHILVLLVASPGTKKIQAQMFVQGGYAVVRVTGPNNQRAEYRLYAEEAQTLSPQERWALLDHVQTIGVSTSCGQFRTALGI